MAKHPLNRQRKFRAAFEWGFIQLAARLVPGEVCVEFPNDTRLLVSPRMKGMAHFIAPGLCEFPQMAFVAHFLRPGEVFVDVGANIGAFTVLAAGVAGANVMAFEPSPESFKILEKNVRLNGLVDRVRLFNAALGRAAGEIQFTTGLGTENRVVPDGAASRQNGDTIRVKVVTLDETLKEVSPRVLKVDAEGYETEIMSGATRLVEHPALRAMIVERAGNSSQYGQDEAILHQMFQKKGFVPFTYDPFARRLLPLGQTAVGTFIYVRDISEADSILRNAPCFNIGQMRV